MARTENNVVRTAFNARRHTNNATRTSCNAKRVTHLAHNTTCNVQNADAASAGLMVSPGSSTMSHVYHDIVNDNTSSGQASGNYPLVIDPLAVAMTISSLTNTVFDRCITDRSRLEDLTLQFLCVTSSETCLCGPRCMKPCIA